MMSFRTHCVDGITVNEVQLARNLERSLMLVTALNPLIGYAKGAEIAKRAFAENRSLRDVAVGEGYVTEEDFDAVMRPENMI